MTSGCRNSATDRQEGFILISVLMVMVVLLSTVTAFAVFARAEVRASREETFQLRSRSAALVALKAATAYIASGDTYHSPVDPVYKDIKVMSAAGLNMAIGIKPLDNKLPLGRIFLPDGVTLREEYKDAWPDIFAIIGKPDMANRVLDFMDKNTSARTMGIEEPWFPNRPLEDVSQLVDLPGMDRKLVYGDGTRAGLDWFLTPFCGEKMNLNTIEPGVFALLDSRINVTQANALVNMRRADPIKSTDDLKKIAGFPADALPRIINVIGVTSQYFEVTVTVAEGTTTRRFVVVLKGSGKGASIVKWSE